MSVTFQEITNSKLNYILETLIFYFSKTKLQSYIESIIFVKQEDIELTHTKDFQFVEKKVTY